MKTNKTEQNQEECEEVKGRGPPSFLRKSFAPQKSLSHARFFSSFFDELGRGEEGGGREGGWLRRYDLVIALKEEELWEISPNTWMSPV